MNDFHFDNIYECCLFLYRKLETTRKPTTSFWPPNDCIVACRLENDYNSPKAVNDANLIPSDKFLKECRAMPFSHVIKTLKSLETSCLSSDFSSSTLFVNSEPKSMQETSAYDYICGCELKVVIEDSQKCDVEELTQVECYVFDLFLSHLQLVLNCRDTIATGKAMLTQGHEAFTALRKAANQSRMPMFQTAISYVVRNRLGAKGYCSWASELLSPHTPIMADFVDTIHKLQSLVEEQKDPIVCVEKMVQVIRRRLSEFFATGTSVSVLMKCCEIINEDAKRVNSNLIISSQTQNPSPKRSTSDGGSLVGKAAFRLIQATVDRGYCRLEKYYEINKLEQELMSSPGVSIKLPSLVAFFKSPEIEKPADVVNEEDVLMEQNEIIPQAVKVASFLNDTSPMETDIKKSLSPLIAEKENIPPCDDFTPKRIKSVEKRSFGLNQREQNNLGQKITKSRKPKKTLIAKKNQSRLTQFFTKV